MSLESNTSALHHQGFEIDLGEKDPRKIVSGWAGVYRNTKEEPRLFCALLPGDTFSAYPGCFIQALTPLRTEPCKDGTQSMQPFIRQSFRLSQYKAAARVADFLFDAYCRLRGAESISGPSYHLPMTQQQLGELLGLSAVHVNRTVKGLRPLIRLEAHQVHVDGLEQLTEMFQPDGTHHANSN